MPTNHASILNAETSAVLWRLRAAQHMRLSRRAISSREFIAWFGFPPTCMHELWEHIKDSMRTGRLRPEHLLWTLHYLKVYPIEINATATWDKSRNTWSQKVEATLAILKTDLPAISWVSRRDDFVPTSGFFKDHTFCVSVAECEVSQPNIRADKELLWNSEAKICSLKYEVCTQITTGRIIRLAGPAVGSTSDKAIFQERGLLQLARDANEKGVADKGYYKEALFDVLTVPSSASILERPLGEAEKLQNRVIASVHITSAKTQGLLKSWGALSNCWRGDLARHATAFLVICKLTNLRMKTHPLVTSPHRLLQGLPTRFKRTG